MRLLGFIFVPGRTWERISTEGTFNPFIIIFVSLLPLLAVACLGEAWGLLRFGEMHQQYGRLHLTRDSVARYELFYGVVSVLGILLGTFLIRVTGQSFSVNAPWSAYLALVVYTWSPIILLHLADGIPFIPTWICYTIGAVLALRIIYHGVAFALKPEQTKGFGMLIVTSIYVIVVSAVVHFASIQVLHNKILKDFKVPWI